MRLEFEPKSSVAVPFVENETAGRGVSSEVERMFREGVRAAQEGRRADARALLLGVTERDADNENAWLWLASISEYPEELLVFLNHVLRINPQNERALEWHKATKSLLSKTLVQRGTEAANENRRDFARQCFEQALEHESENETAWLWMASIADSVDEKTAYFERVLSINPENETARESLRAFETQKTQEYFHAALFAAFDGNHREAKAGLETVLSRDAEVEDAWVLKSHLAESFEERAECFLKLRALNPENEMANAALASWRALGDRLAAFAPRTAEVSGAAFEESADSSSEEVSHEFPNEEPAAEFSPVASDEVAAETETENTVSETEPEASYFAAENEPATNQFEQPENEPAEMYAAEFGDEEDAAPDQPTEDLSLGVAGASPAETADFHESEQNEYVSEEPSAADDEELYEQNSYEEYQAEEVRFDAEEDQAAKENNEAPDNLQAALEAEEAEMSWAFSNARAEETEEAADYFSSYEDDADIHKTQQANYDEADFSHADAAAENDSTEFTVEVESVEVVEETDRFDAGQNDAEWRDTSPSAFVNYSPAAPENAFDEAPTVLFSYTENPVAEEFVPEVVAMEETAAPAPAFEEDYMAQFAPESVPEENFSAQFAGEAVRGQFEMSAEEISQPAAEEKSATVKAETMLCPFCDATNDKQAFLCSSCHTVLTLSDLEMLLSQQNADGEKVRLSVKSMERENESYGLSAEQMMNLGVGHINLKNYRQGFLYLQEAVRMNPSNVLLDAQVNALAIRLSEMEEQQTAHDAMAKNRRILVVDDSPTVRKLISGKLEKCGHEVVCAVDGVDALEKIKDLNPDLVLLDITMPRMDGYQVCKMIRSNESTKDVPVVMISGKDGFFDKVRGRMAGTSGYITKPFGPETLMKTVETYLN